MRLAQLGIVLLSASLPVSGCVCQESRRTRAEVTRSREVAFFDFVHPHPPSPLELWPAGADAPIRRQRQLLTTGHGEDLVVTTDGPDPYFLWDFETPVHAGALSVELLSERAAKLQLFWTTADCKVYEERCSTDSELAVGRQTVDFVLDPGQPLRGVRLDLPEVQGTNLVLYRIRFSEQPRLRSAHQDHEEHSEVVQTPEGLRISAKAADPWLVFPTPWLETGQVGSIELELQATANSRPELYWQGTACSEFSESCKVHLEPLPGQFDAYSAVLTGTPNWAGRARAVRLDPGATAGTYLLRRLVFVRSEGK